MRNQMLLILAIGLLYLLPSVALQAIYGPSFGFMSGEDSWVPDGSGGWSQHGNPTGSAPVQPSVNVPIMVRYIPIFLPAALLVLFMFTPLSRFVTSKPAKDSSPTEAETVDESEPTDRL